MIAFRPLLRTAALAVVLLAASCGSEDPSATSDTRPPATTEVPAGETLSAEEFCARLRELDARAESDEGSGDEGSGATGSGDAAEVAAEVADLAAVAPAEVSDALATIAEVLQQIADLDATADSEGPEEGFGAMEEIMELMFDPEVMAAAQEIEEYSVQECGFDPDEVEVFGDPEESFEDDPMGEDPFAEDDAPTDDDSGFDSENPVNLDSMDELEDANEGQSWVEKSYSTSIVNGTELQLISSDGSDGFGGEPFTEEEAMAACTAIRDRFASVEPDLNIEILVGETVIVRGSASTACAPA